MKKKSSYILLLIQIFFIMIICNSIYSSEIVKNKVIVDKGSTQKIFDSKKNYVDSILKDEIHKLSSKKNEYYFLLAITILIGILGVISCTLQLYEKKWSRIITFICGFSISILTVFSNGMYDYDHRELRRVIHNAESTITEIKLLFVRSSIAVLPEDNIFIYQEFVRLVKKLQEIYNPKISFNIFKIKHAYATSFDEDIIFFATGYGESIYGARKASEIIAHTRVLEYLQVRILSNSMVDSGGLQVQKQLSYSDILLINNLNLVASKCDFDNEKKLYSCSVKYSIQKDVLKKSLELYEAYINKQKSLSTNFKEDKYSSKSLNNEWFVILATFSQLSIIAQPNIFVEDLSKKGIKSYIINSNNYSNLEKGYWIVVLGPFNDKDIAKEKRKSIIKYIPDAYIKNGKRY